MKQGLSLSSAAPGSWMIFGANPGRRGWPGIIGVGLGGLARHPVVGTIFAIPRLGERPEPVQGIVIALIVESLAVTSRR
ncbi:MAG: hypothetical protein IOC35_00190 [Methylobacterium sp.]|nr:hypothetical protein [Methylobacterium sp.]